ncbi:MAG: enoyl-CoA hydratase/isomerase family protein [Acidobacteriota bacterium]
MASADFQTIRYQEQGQVVHLTIDNPPVNVLTLEVIDELDRALQVAADKADLSVLVLHGAGEKAFCAGVDVEAHTPERVETMLESFHRLLRRLWSLEPVTLAVVQGAALGGGCELVSACDLVVAGNSSRFGQPEIKLGCFPPVAAAILPGRIGHHRACQLLYLGEPITASTAAGYGLVNWVVPDDRLEVETDALLDRLGGLSRAALRITRKAIHAASEEAWGRALERSEQLYLRQLTATEDMAEGIRAFIEKREPDWHHR